MSLLTAQERRFAECIGKLVYCNPFLPERIAWEKEALGPEFSESPRVWSLQAGAETERANLAKLVERVEPLAERLRDLLASGTTATPAELILYEDVVLYMLYQRDRMEHQQTIAGLLEAHGSRGPVPYWSPFRSTYERFLSIPGVPLTARFEPAHLFALYFQIRRAFFHIFHVIVGSSLPAARLRAAVWQSIFSHDIARYSRVLFGSMSDYTTLVTGPSGTGKELVARAIGQSRYIPFDASKRRFTDDFSTSFHALNLSALSPTLIESELFGHKRGTFTGAIADRSGWLEICGPLDTVFLDEIGELDPAIQVKLLRVLQTRTFQRLGETKDREFHGKIIAATNRDLDHLVNEGMLRADFYYRLCSDTIATPSLRDQLADQPSDLYNLVLFIARSIVADEAEPVAREVVEWIETNLGRDYAWPGNFRELEQCVRNMLIRRVYQPLQRIASRSPAEELARDVVAGTLTADELLRRYCTIVYASCGSYQAAARRLELDRRTVQAKVERGSGGVGD